MICALFFWNNSISLEMPAHAGAEIAAYAVRQGQGIEAQKELAAALHTSRPFHFRHGAFHRRL